MFHEFELSVTGNATFARKPSTEPAIPNNANTAIYLNGLLQSRNDFRVSAAGDQIDFEALGGAGDDNTLTVRYWID